MAFHSGRILNADNIGGFLRLDEAVGQYVGKSLCLLHVVTGDSEVGEPLHSYFLGM